MAHAWLLCVEKVHQLRFTRLGLAGEIIRGPAMWAGRALPAAPRACVPPPKIWEDEGAEAGGRRLSARCLRQLTRLQDSWKSRAGDCWRYVPGKDSS